MATTTLVKTLLVAGCATFVIWTISKRRKGKWRVVGEVSGLYVHPLKSGRGNFVDLAFASQKGLVHEGLLDRSIAVRRAKNNLKISGREQPKLTQITTEKIMNGIRLKAPGMKPFVIPDSIKGFGSTTIQIFGENIDCQDGGDEIAAWISEYLGLDARISIYPIARKIRSDGDSSWQSCWRLKNVEKDFNQTVFSDGFPYLFLSDESVDWINQQISGEFFTHRSFRPNITMKASSGRPWEEDDLEGELHIGDAIFGLARPCPRCIFTTVDEETGDRRSNGEPLKSLAKIRQAKGRDTKFSHEYAGRPLVGMNLVILKEGKIELGDQIRVRA